MKIDTEVIKDVLRGIDPEAKEDPDFIETLDMIVSAMVRKQKDKNAAKSDKRGNR